MTQHTARVIAAIVYTLAVLAWTVLILDILWPWLFNPLR